MKPSSSVATRLLELQQSLDIDMQATKDRDLRVIMEALALVAEGVAKASRDVKELRQSLRSKQKDVILQKPKPSLAKLVSRR